MSKTISCPFCQSQISVDETASAAVCMACGKGFSLGIAANTATAQAAPAQNQWQPQPQMQNQFQPQPQQQFAPQMQYQQPPMMPVNGYTPSPQRRRPGKGLFVTGFVFNSLASVAGLCFAISLIGYIANDYYITNTYDGYTYYRRPSDFYMFEDLLIAFSIAGGVFVSTAFILNLISIAKYWKLLPPQLSKGTSPAAAVCFMFIPVFSLYWIWSLHLRLGDGLSQMTYRQKPAKGCGIAAAILIFLGSLSPFSIFLQYIGYLIGICGYHSAAKVIEP